MAPVFTLLILLALAVSSERDFHKGIDSMIANCKDIKAIIKQHRYEYGPRTRSSYSQTRITAEPTAPTRP